MGFPPPPPGFKLDDEFSDVYSGASSGARSIPLPPPGFEIDTPSASPYASMLSGAQGIRQTPWYSQSLGSATGVAPGSGPSVMDALNTLPAVGGAVGGAIGGTGGTAFGFGFGGVPGAVGGSALGGAGGEALRQHAINLIGARAPQTSGEAATDIAKEAAIQGASELGGRVVGKTIPRVLAPFADDVSKPVAEAAKRQGIEMPAAALSDSPVVATLEAQAAKGIGGRQAVQRYTDATDMLTKMADHTVTQASKLTDDSARGKAIASGMDAFKDQFIRRKNALYKEAELPEKGIRIKTGETVAFLEEILKGKREASQVLKAGPSADASFYKGILKGLTKIVKDADGNVVKGADGQPQRVLREVEARNVLAAKRELEAKVRGAHADPFAAANEGVLKKLAATLDEEFLAGLQAADPTLAAKLARANAAYSDGIGKLNSTYGEQIHKYAETAQYDKIAESVSKAQVSVDDIPRIMEVAGKEGTDAMRASVLARLVSAAKNPQGQLTPQGLDRAIKSYGERRLNAILLPDQMAQLKDVAMLSSSLQKGRKVMDGSQTAYLLSNMNTPAAFYHLITGGTARKFLASPTGQKFLTTGYRPFTVEGTTRTATRLAHATTYRPNDDGEE